MKVELNLEPEIVLVTQTGLDASGCPPIGCTPNVPCNPNINCNPNNCAPALGQCRPECAPAAPCYPIGTAPEPPRPPRPSCYPG